MDTNQDFESSQGGVVWVPSQSPALQALMTEAQNDRRTRPSTPIYSPSSWTSLSSTTSSASSVWHSSGRDPIDASYPPSLSRNSSLASSSSFAPPGSDPTTSRRVQPLSAVQRQPLASSTSSVNRPPRQSTRPRSSSHSTAPSKRKYMPNDNEPEAVNFIDLLKDANKEVDKNSERKERAVLKREKEDGKRKEHSEGRNGVDNHSDNLPSAQLPIKNSGVYAIPSVNTPEKAPSKFSSARVPKFSGRALTKTASLGAPDAHLVSGKSTPTSLPSPNLNCDLKLAPALRVPAGTSNTSSVKPSAAHKGKAKLNDDENAQQGVIDLAGADSEWERPIAGPSSPADTSMCMQVDDKESDNEMDVSFFKSEPPPESRTPAPKLKPQPLRPTRPSAPTQRAWTGPPPLGMRRGSQLQPSQNGPTQGPKGATVPRFKPPLLANTGGTLHNRSRLAPMATGSQPPRPHCGNASRAPVVETTSQTSQDPDSSFDMSFDVDRDALEEAMKAYD